MTEQKRQITLPDRSVLRLSGPDSRELLQGLVSNDIERLRADHPLYAALLTPQGKFLADFFIVLDVVEGRENILLDCESGRAADLLRRLTMYKMRADVTISDDSDAWSVHALLGGKPDGIELEGSIIFADPRLEALGYRAILPATDTAGILTQAGYETAPIGDYEKLRIAHGIPDGSRDIAVEKNFLLEARLDALNGISFTKGCYVGQELTARTKHRGAVRKMLYPVTIEGLSPEGPAPDNPPHINTVIMMDDKEAGEMRSSCGNHGIALLRTEFADRALAGDGVLTCGEARLIPAEPDWAKEEVPA